MRSRVRSTLDQDPQSTVAWLEAECGVDAEGARQIARYVEVQDSAVGVVPTREEILVERDNAIEETVPLYDTYEERIKELRDWARGRARPASLDAKIVDLFANR